MTQQVPTQSTILCSQCGRPFAQSDLVQIAGKWVCGGCKPAFLSRVVAGGVSGTSKWHYGGFWIRVVARLIDTVVIGVAQACVALAFFGSFLAQFQPGVRAARPIGLTLGFQVLSYGMAFFYEVAFLRYRGATPPGKWR